VFLISHQSLNGVAGGLSTVGVLLIFGGSQVDDKLQAEAKRSVDTDRPYSTTVKPTLQELLKRWVEWAFVPSKQLYNWSSYGLKHEVERSWPNYYVPEREFIRAMAEAGFGATKKKDGRTYFYVAESPSRKTYHRDLQKCWGGSVTHPLYRLDPTKEFNKLPPAEQRRLIMWIAMNVSPRKKRTTPAWILHEACCSQYSAEHYAAFCGAMLRSGYQPVNPAEDRWRFRVGANWSHLSDQPV
jgi:hypothetical protein